MLGTLLAPPATLLLMRTVPNLDLILHSAVAHLVVANAISAAALAGAVAAAAAAGRSRHGSLVLLAPRLPGGRAFMLGHGLLTQGTDPAYPLLLSVKNLER